MRKSLIRADLDATQAADAVAVKPPDPGGALLALRVMAPAAGQRTALEKNCRANAGAIVYGISADVKNCTGDQDPTFLSK